MKSIIFLSVFVISFQAVSGLTEDFDIIKNQGYDLEATGTICELIAQLRFAEKYPQPKYNVVTGIEYADQNRTLGELDLVVFNNKTGLAEIVAEVKCWKNPKSGLKKAEEQRTRFVANVKSAKALKFKWLSDPTVQLAKTQFTKISEFYFIAQSETQAYGFDYELPYTLRELMQLRSDILSCQANGSCRKSGHLHLD